MDSHTETQNRIKSSNSASVIPKTPKSEMERDRINEEIDQILESLSGWGIDLLANTSPQSPSKRLIRAMQSEEQAEANKCSFMIKFLRFKSDVFPILSRFDQEARQLYSEWARKPKADLETLPAQTRQNMRPMTSAQKREIQKLLHDLLETKYVEVRGPTSPSKAGVRADIFASKSFSGLNTSKTVSGIDPAKSFGGIDASKSFPGPVKSTSLFSSEPEKDFAAKASRSSNLSTKLASFETVSETTETAEARECLEIDMGTNVAPIPFILTPRQVASKRALRTTEDERHFKIPRIPNAKDRSFESGTSAEAYSCLSSRIHSFKSRSTDTSFISHISRVSSQGDHNYVSQSTQTTVEDEPPKLATQVDQNLLCDDTIPQESENWGSSLDPADINLLDFNAADTEKPADPQYEALSNEEKLRIRLEHVFREFLYLLELLC
ncbi:hypothetical protein BP6252_11468 [Coleophoma cylindrospora]|uniref:Uncharacterized protein n=1 Tax=Coleophoma cylindrospora TaxID=1849047 RepID=A0A3D8QJQ1_9HELO|nr:hypothetical protein BP6252_11468 [Coleophoma cylindrospora]